jgi:hypothetical protein
VFGTAWEWEKDDKDGHYYRKDRDLRITELEEDQHTCPYYAVAGFQLLSYGFPLEMHFSDQIPAATPELRFSDQIRADALLQVMRRFHVDCHVGDTAGMFYRRAMYHFPVDNRPHFGETFCDKRDVVKDLWAEMTGSLVGKTHSFWSVNCRKGRDMLTLLFDEPFARSTRMNRVKAAMVNLTVHATSFEEKVSLCVAEYLESERRLQVGMTGMAGPDAEEERFQRRAASMEWESRGKYLSRELALARHGLHHFRVCYHVTCHRLEHLPLHVETTRDVTLVERFNAQRDVQPA